MQTKIPEPEGPKLKAVKSIPEPETCYLLLRNQYAVLDNGTPYPLGGLECREKPLYKAGLKDELRMRTSPGMVGPLQHTNRRNGVPCKGIPWNPVCVAWGLCRCSCRRRTRMTAVMASSDRFGAVLGRRLLA